MPKLSFTRRVVQILRKEKKTEEKSKMKLISLWITPYQLKMLKWMVAKGMFPSISEAIRFAVSQMIYETLERERYYRDMTRLGR